MSSRVPVRSSLLGAAPLSEGALTDFRRRFHGDVLVEGEPPYDEVRRVWNQMVDRRPAVIARCTGVADVRTALASARSEGLDVTVRCGGHSIVGHGVADGAVLLDLAPMRGVRVDPDRRQVWVQGGARLRDLDRETHPFGVGVPVGVVGDTGVGGLSLGGGYGFATRRYGLTCDNLLAAEVVTADGELVVVDEEHEPELLWGLKGGGGNFGVVTGLTFRMHPLGPISYGDHLYPIDEGLAPLRALLDLLRDGPDEVTASAVVASAPAADWVPAEWQGRPAVMVSWVFHGPVEEGRRLCASLAAGRPVASAEAETTYAELQAFSDVVPGEVGRRYWKGALVTDLPDEALEMILRRGAGEGDREPSCAVELFGLGGAFGRVGDLDTAFGHRGSVCDVLVVSGWTDPADDEWRLAEARGLAAQVAQYADGAYVNSLEEETDADAVRSAYGATTFDRLTALKDRYDPANVFHHNQNVRPSAG